MIYFQFWRSVNRIHEKAFMEITEIVLLETYSISLVFAIEVAHQYCTQAMAIF